MTKPTREEVEQLKKDYRVLASLHAPIGKLDEILLTHILDAYLAQEEELEVVELEKHTMCEAWEKQNKIIEQLKAENQALKASMEADYIEWQAKHIQELVKENEALKVLAQSIVDYSSKYEEYRIDTDFLPVLKQAKELTKGPQP